MPDVSYYIDWSVLTVDGEPPSGDVPALLDAIASYRPPRRLEDEWSESGFEHAYHDLAAVSPELIPHLIPFLLKIVDTPEYQGKWRVLSLIMWEYSGDWSDYISRTLDAGLGVRIQSVFLTGQPVYLRCLEDQEPATREMAACALGMCRTSEAINAMKGRLPRETVPQVRRYIRTWLERGGLPLSDPIFTTERVELPDCPPQQEPTDDIPF